MRRRHVCSRRTSSDPSKPSWGGANATETYILIANVSDRQGVATVRLHFEDGTTAVKEFNLAALSRINVIASIDFPQSAGKLFSVVVESTGPNPVDIVVERAMYSNGNGATWAAGTNAVGTKLQ